MATEEKVKVIGYYIDADVPEGEETSNDVFLVLDIDEKENGTKSGYAPQGQHMTVHMDYAKSCREISKERYLKISKGFYTPQDYL